MAGWGHAAATHSAELRVTRDPRPVTNPCLRAPRLRCLRPCSGRAGQVAVWRHRASTLHRATRSGAPPRRTKATDGKPLHSMLARGGGLGGDCDVCGRARRPARARKRRRSHVECEGEQLVDMEALRPFGPAGASGTRNCTRPAVVAAGESGFPTRGLFLATRGGQEMWRRISTEKKRSRAADQSATAS